MAYIIAYIVGFLTLTIRALHIKARESKNNRYYSYPENAWLKVMLIPAIVAVLMYIVFPHDKLVRGGTKTSIIKELETETILMRSVHKFTTERTGPTTFWWGTPMLVPSQRYIEITNKLDSSVVIVDDFSDIENYEFKKVNNE